MSLFMVLLVLSLCKNYLLLILNAFISIIYGLLKFVSYSIITFKVIVYHLYISSCFIGMI